MSSKPKPHRHRRTLCRRGRQNLRVGKTRRSECRPRRHEVPLHQLQQVSGVHCRRNRIGPRTDPCGTPYRTADGVEQPVLTKLYNENIGGHLYAFTAVYAHGQAAHRRTAIGGLAATARHDACGPERRTLFAKQFEVLASLNVPRSNSRLV